MWVEGEEGMGDAGLQRAAKEAVQENKATHPGGLNCVIDFSHLPAHVFIPSDRVCLRPCVC